MGFFKWFHNLEYWLRGGLLLAFLDIVLSIICALRNGPVTVPLNYMGLRIVLELFPVSFTGGMYPGGLNSGPVLLLGIIINTIIFFFIGGFLGWLVGEIVEKIGHKGKKRKKRK